MTQDLNITLQQLKGFVTVARLLSFSKAARRTYVSQPAISLQIKALEEQLGAPLFERSGGSKIRLTEKGEMLRDIAEPLVHELQSLKKRFNEMQEAEVKGPLRIATHSSVMMYLLPDVIKEFKERFPACVLSVLNRGRQDIVSMLENDEVDIGITSLTDIPKAINYEVFARFKRLLIAPKRHPLSIKARISLQDIAGTPLLLPPKGSNTRAVVDRAFAGQGLSYSLAMETTGKHATKAYVEMGLGISIMNEFYATKDDRKTLFICDVSKFFGYADRGILTREKGYLSRAAEIFKEILRKKYPLNSS